MTKDLKAGVLDLQTTTTAALGVLAVASGIYTYIGVRGLLDGSNLLTLVAAVAYSAAVSVGIYVFWLYILKFLPYMRSGRGRLGMAVAVVVGSLAIVAMSSWLNAAALAGSAAVEQHLAESVEDYQEQLEQAHKNALAAQELVYDTQRAATRFRELAVGERQQGALSGTSGAGTVVAFLNQMASQFDELGNQIAQSREAVQSLYHQGGQHLTRMREYVAGTGSVAERSITFAEEALELTGVIITLEQTSIAPAVKRAADDLSASFIEPVASGQDPDLRQRQGQAVERIKVFVEEQGKALSRAADQILELAPVAPRRFAPVSTAEAVLMYAEDFIPSWAGAISIDLLPGVLVLILMIVQSAIREDEDPQPLEATLTLRELSAALDALGRIERKTEAIRTPEQPKPENPSEADAEPVHDDSDGKIARVGDKKAAG
jgi:hypothetical protein